MFVLGSAIARDESKCSGHPFSCHGYEPLAVCTVGASRRVGRSVRSALRRHVNVNQKVGLLCVCSDATTLSGRMLLSRCGHGMRVRADGTCRRTLCRRTFCAQNLASQSERQAHTPTAAKRGERARQATRASAEASVSSCSAFLAVVCCANLA